MGGGGLLVGRRIHQMGCVDVDGCRDGFGHLLERCMVVHFFELRSTWCFTTC